MCTQFIQELSLSYIWDAMGNMSAVPQEKIVDYLLERLERGQIYTWVGTLLLAINPNGLIVTKSTYDLSQAHEYDNICDVTHKEVSPHIFAVAARAHYKIVQGLGKPSQVIVLNGETGTGKTFNAWKALEFLTRSISPDACEKRDAVCSIVQKISNACRLISVFTTAPTERNVVSSRHVQLVWLEYKMGGICGATISSYLLERDRVTKGCCNFQIFGQMMTAVASIEFADTKLSRDTRYFMLSDLDSLKIQELNDGFRETLKAMDMLGFTENQKKDIFFVLSLLIHMGNIQFVQEDDHCRIDTNDRQSKEALENTCRLACVKQEDVAELLTSILINPQSIRRRHTICRRNLNTSDACRYRLHSIIRHLYDLLFRWLINSVNEILSACLFSERLGILDIFGFECFHSNGIEQLCVNYVNERLQQYFVEKYLVSCRDDLQKEGLIDDEEPAEIMRSYEDRINTLEKNLFTTLNDMCLSTVPNNSFTLIRQVCAKSCSATRRFLNVRNDNFVVRHYSGVVEYSVHDLLSKNTDKVPDEINTTFSLSKNKFLYSLINYKMKSYHHGKARKPTTLSKLRCNVDLLIQELNKCDTHYVRCIKPQRLNNNEWDRDHLRKQLANTGVLDALPLARCKYPIHFVYKDFFKRYNRKRMETCDLRISCKNILESFRLTMDDDNSSVHYGKRLIFLKESMFLRLEFARRRYRVECVRKIESSWIKYKKDMLQNTEENVTDVCTIDNSQNELTEKSQSEYKHVASVSGINLHAENYQTQDIKGNLINDDQTNVTNDVRHKASKLERSLLEYERMLSIEDCSGFMPNCVELLTKLAKKTAYILHWLDDVNRATDTKNIKPSILEQLRKNRPDDRSVDINWNNNSQLQYELDKSSNNNKFCMRDRYKNFGDYIMDYNEKEDMYVVQYSTFTLFYKNGILSRRRPTRLPVRIHTRLRCLTNSHYLVHTELPRGLQDCL